MRSARHGCQSPDPRSAGGHRPRAHRSGGGVRPSARQLLRQPPRAGERVRGSRRRALHPRRGRDPDLPAARRLRRDAARPQARRGRAAARADRRRAARRRCARPAARRSRTRWDRAACARRASSCRCRRASETRGGSSCATARSPGAWAGRRSSPHRDAAPRSARTCPRATPPTGLRTYPDDLLQSPSDVRAARLDAQPGTGTLTAPDGSRTVRGRRRALRRRADEGLRRRRRGGGGPAAPPAGRVRLGRGARALARPRQGDGRRVPGRHARPARGTRSRSARS